MKSKGNILVIDDDSYILLSLQTLLERHFKKVLTDKDPKSIPFYLKNHNIDVVLLDMNFEVGETSGDKGLEWIEKALEIDKNLSIVPITAYGGVPMAVRALKAGAIDFVVKPWQNEKMLSTVTAALNYTLSKRNAIKLEHQRDILNNPEGVNQMIGESKEIQKVLNQIKKVAATDANILILGENGTGKELVARQIHSLSTRNKEVFISVDLGSIPETLFESELFGYKKGAFTDAKTDKPGRFEAAENGTLFLDEIGNLPASLQQKLLSVLQNREIFQLGSNTPTPINTRILSATNQSINEAVEKGEFRQDLLYRLNTIEVKLPALRERKSDIPVITQYYLKRYSRKYKKDVRIISPHAEKQLLKYEWPGNVRELQHTIERAVIMCDDDQIKPMDLQLSSAEISEELPVDTFNLDSIEKWAIMNCMKKHSGNVTKAAKELGLTRGAMYRRLEKYGLQ